MEDQNATQAAIARVLATPDGKVMFDFFVTLAQMSTTSEQRSLGRADIVLAMQRERRRSEEGAGGRVIEKRSRVAVSQQTE